MKKQSQEFSASQWQSLAAISVLRRGASVDLIAVLSPLLPSQLSDLLNRSKLLGWLIESENSRFLLSSNLPDYVKKKLQSLSTKDLVSIFLERLTDSELCESVELNVKTDLLSQAGRSEEAAILENALGQKALKNGLMGPALESFEKVIDWIPDFEGKPEQELLFTSTVLELSHLRFCDGDQSDEIPELLLHAQKAAMKRGDRRSNILLKLHMGMHICNQDRLGEAIEVLGTALSEAKELGDDDILSQTAEFSGLYFLFQGKFKEALGYFEEAFQSVELYQENFGTFFIPHWLGLCAAYIGQFHRAIGVFGYNWRRAQQRSEWGLADNFRADLGIVLLLTGKTEEAYIPLSEMLESALEKQNQNGIFVGRMGIAYYHYLENRPKESHSIMTRAVKDADNASILFQQYSWPWFLELLYEFNRLNYKPIPRFNYDKEIERMTEGPNILLRGVAFRLKAKEAVINQSNADYIEFNFSTSERYLKQSGNPLELGKTWVGMARSRLRHNDYDTAWDIALMAWEAISGFNPELFPDDLRPLLEGKFPKHKVIKAPRNSLDMLIELLDKHIICNNTDAFLQRLLLTTSKFFGAARGGIFWSDVDRNDPALKLKVGTNLSEEEAFSEEFQSNLASVLEAFKKNQPLINRNDGIRFGTGTRGVLTSLCIPFEVKEKVQGVLFHENSYHDKAFVTLPEIDLKMLARYIGGYIERVTGYFQNTIEISKEKIIQTSLIDQSEMSEMKAESSVMKRLLSQADNVADSDASILILGETGVGKELLAKRLHRMNLKRHKGPFHIVDVTNISESLIESELFGHEKGSFTGADQRKIGRLELSHQGTLFIDEIGNTSLATQAKLLRAIQEKNFFRVGGTKNVQADFRLLAATNQDLEKAVSEGHFRADLFYRINVVPLVIPPLRDRGKDILLLARHFLKYYLKKHGRNKLDLSLEVKNSLKEYHWPGNVRELKNVIERAVLLSSNGYLELNLTASSKSSSMDNPFTDLPTFEDLQRRYISHVLEKTNGRIGGPGAAAEILGMKRTTLSSRIKKLGIQNTRLS